jgi:Domain of unknown function (DUF4279)
MERVLQEDEEWSRAAVRIFGDDLQPEEIETALGLKATRSHIKGQPRSPRYKGVWHETYWCLDSPLADERNMTDHLNWLLDSLEPRGDVIKALSGKYRIDFFCGFSSGNGQGGFTLDRLTLRRIADLGVQLVLDLYPTCIDVEEETREAERPDGRVK